jgi:hypothetical protein
MAQRQRFSLIKSRRRDHLALEYGKYALWDELTKGAALGWVTLDDVISYLMVPKPTRKWR